MTSPLSIPVNFNIQIQGNDCRCCRPSDAGGSSSELWKRVVYCRGVSRHRLFRIKEGSSGEKRREEDEKTIRAFQNLVDEVKKTYDLVSDDQDVPRVRGNHVCKLDVLLLTNWIAGVEAAAKHKAVSDDLTIARGESPPPDSIQQVEITDEDRSHLGKVKIIWNPEKKTWEKKLQSFFSSFSQHNREQNKQTKSVVILSVIQFAANHGIPKLDEQMVPINVRSNVSEPFTAKELLEIQSTLR